MTSFATEVMVDMLKSRLSPCGGGPSLISWWIMFSINPSSWLQLKCWATLRIVLYVLLGKRRIKVENTMGSEDTVDESTDKDQSEVASPWKIQSRRRIG